MEKIEQNVIVQNKIAEKTNALITDQNQRVMKDTPLVVEVRNGSYSTQDALGDLLVTDVLHRKRTSESAGYIRANGDAELYARSASRDFKGVSTYGR